MNRRFKNNLVFSNLQRGKWGAGGRGPYQCKQVRQKYHTQAEGPHNLPQTGQARVPGVSPA